MQEFDHTSREDYTYTEQEMSCPYFDECLFRKDNECSVNAFIGRQYEKEDK